MILNKKHKELIGYYQVVESDLSGARDAVYRAFNTQIIPLITDNGELLIYNAEGKLVYSYNSREWFRLFTLSAADVKKMKEEHKGEVISFERPRT